MSVVLVTGSAGLIGSQAALHFAAAGLDVVGVDNDMRKVFFGEDSSTAWMVHELERELGARYRHASGAPSHTISKPSASGSRSCGHR